MIDLYEISYRQTIDGNDETSDIYTETVAADSGMDPLNVVDALRKRVTSSKWPWVDDDGRERLSAVTGFRLRGLRIIKEDVEVFEEPR